MTSNLNARFLNPLPINTDETVLLIIDSENFIVFTPKCLKWEEITLPDEIKLEDAHPP